MGFFDDLLRGATAPGVMQNGMNIGLQGLADAQRKRELQAQIQREQEQQAFINQFKQREFDQNQQNWNQTRQDNVYNNQQDDVYRDTAFRVGLEQQLAANALAKDKYQNVELPESKAKISNYQEGRAPSQEEFLWRQMTPEQQQAFLESYTQNKFKPAAAGNQGAKITPAGLVSLRGQMTNPIQGGRMDMPFDSIAAMAGKIQNTADSLNNVNGGQMQSAPMMNQDAELSPADQEAIAGLSSMNPEEIDWQATMAKYPNLNWNAIMQKMGAK